MDCAGYHGRFVGGLDDSIRPSWGLAGVERRCGHSDGYRDIRVPTC